MLQSVWRPAFRPVMSSPFETAAGGGPSLTEQIRKLFANGEQGALYYFTPDFAGLYQDAAGTTPVTAAGQPVGLMLDRRFGLARGEEVIPVLDFTSAEWEFHAGGGEGGGALSPNSFEGSTVSCRMNNTSALEIGKWYELSVDVEINGDPAPIGVYNGTSGTTGRIIWDNNNTVRGSAIFRAENSTLAFRIGAGNRTMTVHAISIRELPGNHASQATTTARPTLRSAPLRIDYDGVDDYLRTEFPDLGGDVTIARSIPGVGAQILTGQTIAAGDWDDNVTSCATLIIDRALTGPETALVTAFLNQQAGV